jgi:RsiW-degrading membrane proteinase PrsW (M82 family)
MRKKDISGSTAMKHFKQRWLQIFIVGLILFALTDVTLRVTGNVNYFPTLMLIGAFLVPTAFIAYFYQQENIFDRHPSDNILPAILLCALLGGLIGTVAAGLLEYITLTSSSLITLSWIGPIEEFAKLIGPVALYIIMRNRFRTELDGLLFGVTAGMAFAALETMGYELVALINSQGNINILDETILVRSLLSPAGHASWTGLITASLWRQRQSTGKAFTPVVFAFFLLAASLHTAWDFASFSNSLTILVPSYVAITTISLGLLIWRLQQSKRLALVAVPVVIDTRT